MKKETFKKGNSQKIPILKIYKQFRLIVKKNSKPRVKRSMSKNLNNKEAKAPLLGKTPFSEIFRQSIFINFLKISIVFIFDKKLDI